MKLHKKTQVNCQANPYEYANRIGVRMFQTYAGNANYNCTRQTSNIALLAQIIDTCEI